MADHATRAHARFGASSAHRWFACPGSVTLTRDMPDAPSPAALEGTRAHELLEALLKNVLQEFPGSNAIGEYAAALWEAADQETRDAVHVVVDHVTDLVEDHSDAVVLVEHRFEVPVAAAPGEVFGTCDCVVFLPSLRTLHVVDYKHGAGVWVEARGNKQLRFYGLGALASFATEDWTGKPCPHCKGTGRICNPMWDETRCDSCGGTGDEYGPKHEIDTVVLTVIQPRHWRWDGRPSEEWLPVEEVLEFGKEVGEAIARCKQVVPSLDVNGVARDWIDGKTGAAALVPGEEQCQWCPARFGACLAREALAASAFDGVADVALYEPRAVTPPTGMSGARLAEVLGVADGIRAYLRDLEEEAERRLRAGGDVPGWKLVEAQARRQWNSEDVDAVAYDLACVMRGSDDTPAEEAAQFKVEKLRGLGEVEAILKAGCDCREARRRLDAMAYLTTKKSSGALKVARADDPRPAAVLGSAFDGVVQVEDER